MRLPNPLIHGFNPDPSIVKVGDDYLMVTSTFEYVPGLPVYRSTDLDGWELIGHVIERTEQFDATHVPTNMGMWAPTIRHHDGLFHVIVGAAGIGTRVYTAEDPAGPWSDGLELPGVEGIDPDLAWDADGTCYVTYSGLVLRGPAAGTHLGIQQVRVDLSTGESLEDPRSMWSGTGLMFPEAPHLYRIGEWWYLMIAEGGTERGHTVSIARAATPDGPFEGCPANPVLSARSTARPVQNTGHGDLVEAPDGSWSMVLLGMRTRGMTRSFSPLGRQTFGTHVEWVDGWPVVDPVELTEGRSPADFTDDFDAAGAGDLDRSWVGVRRHPTAVSTVEAGSLVLGGDGASMDDPRPTFVGRRQQHDDSIVSTAVLEPSAGIGGLSLRYDEQTHYDVEVDGTVAPPTVTARAAIPTFRQETSVEIAPGPVELRLEIATVDGGFDQADADSMLGSDTMMNLATCDRISFVAIDAAGTRHELATHDGRYLSAEAACSFTGRVVGPYCTSGELRFDRFSETARA